MESKQVIVIIRNIPRHIKQNKGKAIQGMWSDFLAEAYIDQIEWLQGIVSYYEAEAFIDLQRVHIHFVIALGV